jgi:hypothetical protein
MRTVDSWDKPWLEATSGLMAPELAGKERQHITDKQIAGREVSRAGLTNRAVPSNRAFGK